MFSINKNKMNNETINIIVMMVYVRFVYSVWCVFYIDRGHIYETKSTSGIMFNDT